MRKTIPLIAAVLIVTGCGIYGKYSRPQMDVEGPRDVELMSWREFFTDPLLQDLIDTAICHNTDLKVAALRCEEASARMMAATMAFLPSLTASASARSADDWSMSADGSWQIDLFGRQLNATRSARAALEGSEAYRQAVLTKLISSVADSYFTLLLLDSQLKISEETLENWETMIQVQEALKLAGRATDVAVLQSKAKKLNLEAGIVETRKSVVLAQNSLCTLMGVPMRTLSRSDLAAQVLPASFADSLDLSKVASRPDVRQAEALLAQAFYDTQEARGSFFPSLKLSGSALTRDLESVVFDAVASLTQPLFQKGALMGDYKASLARQKEAEAQFRQILLSAAEEVTGAQVKLRCALDREEIDALQVASLASAVEKIDLMMKYSSTNYLEVITAKQSLLDARLVQEKDRLASLQALTSLYNAVGGGER